MRAGVILLALAISSLGMAPGAEPGVDVSGGVIVEDDTPVARVESTPQPGGKTPRAGVGGESAAPPICTHSPLPPGEVVLDVHGRPRVAPAGTGWTVRSCRRRDGTQVSYELAPLRSTLRSTLAERVDPAVLARQAMARLPLTAPRVGTSPGADLEQLVNLPTWLWVEADGWEPQSATASVPGASVTVTATPRSVTWDMGTGERVVCDGPGTPYDLSRREEEQSTECSYAYRWPSAGQPGGRYRVTATMTWDVSWSAAGVAGGGDLGELSRATSLALRVAEGQAVVTASG